MLTNLTKVMVLSWIERDNHVKKMMDIFGDNSKFKSYTSSSIRLQQESFYPY